MKRLVYAALGVAVLGFAGFFMYRALGSSLVYFLTPSEYAADVQEYAGRRLRLGGIVQPGTVKFNDQNLQLTFMITDTVQTYPVSHRGAPPELFKEGMGVVVEGKFDGNEFHGDNVLVKHSEQYQPPQAGQPVDVQQLKESLQ